MGMQTVRAILSEDIDTCLNIAVNDYIKKVIADNVKMSGNNKIYIDNAKIGQINVLRTLIDKLEISNITINKEENKILLGRFGNPNEVAELVFFLVSDNASYINNSIIRIDGGKKC